MAATALDVENSVFVPAAAATGVCRASVKRKQRQRQCVKRNEYAEDEQCNATPDSGRGDMTPDVYVSDVYDNRNGAAVSWPTTNGRGCCCGGGQLSLDDTGHLVNKKQRVVGQTSSARAMFEADKCEQLSAKVHFTIGSPASSSGVDCCDDDSGPELVPDVRVACGDDRQVDRDGASAGEMSACVRFPIVFDVVLVLVAAKTEVDTPPSVTSATVRDNSSARCAEHVAVGTKLFWASLLRHRRASITALVSSLNLAARVRARLASASSATRSRLQCDECLAATCVMLAYKFTEDVAIPPAAWARMGWLPAATLNALEREVLALLDYRLHLPPLVFKVLVQFYQRTCQAYDELFAWGGGSGEIAGGIEALECATILRELLTA